MERIYLDDPSDTHALDTDDKHLGAPGRPGELRDHYHPTYGWQVYRLVLNESGGSLAAYYGIELAAGTAYAGATAAQASDAGTTDRMFGGVPQNAIADDYWGWSLVAGEGLAVCAEDCAQNAPIEPVADGELDDAGGGDEIGILLGTTVGSAAPETARVLLCGII